MQTFPFQCASKKTHTLLAAPVLIRARFSKSARVLDRLSPQARLSIRDLMSKHLGTPRQLDSHHKMSPSQSLVTLSEQSLQVVVQTPW